MPVVQNVALDPAGNPSRAAVTIRLIAGDVGTVNTPGYGADCTILGVTRVRSDDDGYWSAALEPNDDILPDGTFYEVCEQPAGTHVTYVHYIQVPDVAGPVDLVGILVEPVTTPDSLYLLATQKGASGGLATLDGAGQVPADQLGNASGGGGGGAVDSVFGRTGVVVAQSGDYTKSQVGLGNVDNTADTGKPVSTAQAAADAAVATGAANALSAHEADTTNVHGIPNTASLVLTNDSRLSDARTPTAHASSHASAGSDPVTLAQSQVTNLVTDLAGKQAADTDLTAIAAIDSSVAGALATDGSGWIRKTYAALKTALALVKADVGLGNVDNTADTAKPVSTAAQTALDAKVTGPASATDNAVARFDATTGKLIQDSLFAVNDDGTVVLTAVASAAYAAGKLVYDSDNDCLTFFNSDSAVSMQIGQEVWIRVRNVTGSTIANGAPVYVTGIDATTGLPTVALANAGAAATMPAVGLCTEALATASNGFATLVGNVNGLNTAAFTIGQAVYVATVAGTLTATAPASPNLRQRVGVVTRVDTTLGRISVLPGGAILGYGTANQVVGMNAAATAQEHKTIAGTTNRLTVTHGVGTVTLDVSATLMALYATLASPAFTGTPSLPTGATGFTQTAGNSSTALATTAFVTTADNLKANLAGPTFTGVPAAPTAAQGTNTGQLATTAYVQTEAGLLVPKSLVDAKGDLLVGTANDTVARLPVGADTFVLTADSAQSAGVKWAAASGGSGTDLKPGAYPRTGLWYRAPGFGPVGSNVTTVLNTLYLVPFRLGVSTTFDRITCDITTANGAGSVVRMGIWASDGAGSFPGTLILDVGTISTPAGDSTGQKIVTISQLLSAGVYWLGLVAQTAGGGSARGSTAIDPLVPYFTGAGANFGATAPGGIQTGTTVSGALASSPTITDNNNGPIMGLRAT